MNLDRSDEQIQEKIKKILADPPQYTFSQERRREFIARFYKVPEERRNLSDYFAMAARNVPLYARVAVMASVLLFCANYLFSPVYPVVSGVRGTVKIYHAARNEWAFAPEGRARLAKNDVLKTFGDGQADVAVPGVYHVRLKSDSELRLARAPSRLAAGRIGYELDKGKVFTYYRKKEGAGREFDIKTPQAVATAVGTDFMVEAMPALNTTWVGVLDGAVRVTGMEAAVMVAPGEKTTVFAGKAPARPTRLMESEMLELEELYRIGTKPQVALLISMGATRTRELLQIAPLYISSERPGVLPDKIERAARTFSQAIKEGAKEKYVENIGQFEELVNKYPNPKYDVQFLLFIAAYYEYLDEHAKAIGVFQRVIDSYPKSNLASIAQCAIGVIYEEKIKDLERARKAYEKVLSHYPKSTEVEEAGAGLGRIAKARERISATYNKDYPKGRYRTTVYVTEGTVFVADYDEKAGPDYARGAVLTAGQKIETQGKIS